MLRNVAVLLVSPEIDEIKISISYSSTSQEIQLIKDALQKHANMRMHISI